MLIEDGPFAGLVKHGYSTILLDPSWHFAVRSTKGEGRSASQHYKTMTLDELKVLPVWDLAAKHCVMFMWVIDTHLPQALELMTAWEFKFKTVGFYWMKTNKDGTDFMGMGFWSRSGPESLWIANYEPLVEEPSNQALLATHGNPIRNSKNVRRLIQSPRRQHSRKPDEAYERIEALVDGPYIELFSRKNRPGWTAWGFETGKFDSRLDDMLDTSPRRSVEDMLT